LSNNHCSYGCGIGAFRLVQLRNDPRFQAQLTKVPDNALVTQSRLILLDSPLVIFTALTALAWTSFTNQHEQGPTKAFQPSWWFWLLSTGVGLGATVSVKWVGLFTIAWVGSLTLVQLWVLLGDSKTVTPVRLLYSIYLRPFLTRT